MASLPRDDPAPIAVEVPAPTPPGCTAAGERPQLDWRRTLCLCSLLFGISVTEWVSLHVLPLTLANFTPDAAIIGLVLAVNPLFGFIVQPAVGIWSDRVWTRFGRRAPFLMVGSLVVAACVATIPLLQLFWQLVVVIVVYQIFQDVLYGSDSPLLADTVPVRWRPLVQGMLTVTSQFAGVLVLRFGLPWLHAHQETTGGERFGAPVYWLAAAFQVVCVCGAALFLREKRHAPPISHPPLTLRSYVRGIAGHDVLRRLALLNFLRAFQGAAANGFLVLFATMSLDISADDYGEAAAWMPVVGMGAAVLAGWSGMHLSRPALLAMAFVGFGGAYGIAYASDSLVTLTVAMLVMGLWQSFVEVTFKSFVTEFLPPNMVGQLLGAMNICFATGRTFGYVLVGFIVSWCGNNYRVAWLVAIGAVVANVLVLVSLRDPRNIAGKSDHSIVGP